jgi:hypothetical protein
MANIDATNVTAEVQPLKLRSTWLNNGVFSGIELNYQFALKHHHFYDGGECFHHFDEAALWHCVRALGIQHFESAWDEMALLFEAGRAHEVDAWIEVNCKTLASYYNAA